MFTRKKLPAGEKASRSRSGARAGVSAPAGRYLPVAAVCFILALKGLSSPQHGPARQPGRRASARCSPASWCSSTPTSTTSCRSWSRSRSARSIGVVGAHRVQMTQMPQLVALFNGVGGGAAALVALLELDELGRQRRRRPRRSRWRRPRSRSWSARCQLRRLAGHLRQAAGADDHAAGDLPRPPDRVRRCRSLAALGARRRRSWSSRPCGPGSCSALVGLLLGVLLVLPVGGADVPIVISLLNAFTGLTVAAGGYVLDNTLLLVAGTLVGAAGTLLTKLMANAMGRSVANILFGALKGGSTLGAGEASRPAGALGRARGRRDPAGVRQPGDHRPRLRARRRPGAAHPAGARRRAGASGASRSTTRSTRSPAGCPVT